MATALEGFLKHECDSRLGGQLRAEIKAHDGAGYDYFNFNLGGRGIQTNVFFAGIIVAASATNPNVLSRFRKKT